MSGSRRPVLLVVAGLVLVVSIVGALTLFDSDAEVQPVDEAWTVWPVRGDLAGDTDLIERVVDRVDAPHPHVLWIGRLGQADKAIAYVAAETGRIPRGTAATAVLHTIGIVPSTKEIREDPDTKTFRTSDLGIETPELIDAVPRLDSYPVNLPLLTAAGVDKVEFRSATDVVATAIRPDGVAYQTTPTPKTTSPGCQPPVPVVTARNGDVQAVQVDGPSVEIPRFPEDRPKAIQLLVSLMAGLQCNKETSDYSLVEFQRLTAGTAWLDGRGPYEVLRISLTQETGRPAQSLAITFPSGTSAVVGNPTDNSTNGNDPLAVKVDLGDTDAVLTTKLGNQPPVTVPALPILFNGPVVLFGPYTARVAVVHFDPAGNAASTTMV